MVLDRFGPDDIYYFIASSCRKKQVTFSERKKNRCFASENEFLRLKDQF